jgi:N-acetylglucosaminyldiphosphoundecaprenol N-acetyl-beta-D-mannosaminyltransferase
MSDSKLSVSRPPRLQILNASIDNFTMRELLDQMDSGFLITPNADHLVSLQEDKEFYDLYQQADYVTVDSQILLFALKVLGQPVKEKISGSDFFPQYCMHHRDNPDIRIYLLGAMPGIAVRAASNINERIGREIVVAYHSPSFGFETNEAECQEIIERINQSTANVLVVGVGAPKQEKWIQSHRDKLTGIHTFMALGATIDFEAGTLARAPSWMSTLGLEWLYRLTREPGRLWRRYLVRDTRFIYLVFKEMLNLYRNPFQKQGHQ